MASGSVDSFSILNEIEEIIRKNNPKKVVNHITIPMIQVEKLYLEQKSRVDSNISRLSLQIKTMESEIRQSKISIQQLEKSLEESNVSVSLLSRALQKQRLLSQKKRQELERKDQKLETIAKRDNEIKNIINLKKRIDEKLKTAFAGNPYFNPDKDVLVFSSSQFFPKGETAMSDESRKIIAQTTEKYLAVLLSIPETKKYLKRIIISGHTDSDGTLEYNMHLSAQRAKTVKNIVSGLKSMQGSGLLPLLESKGYADRHAIMINGIEDKNASRRTEIRYILDEMQITEAAEKLLKESTE